MKITADSVKAAEKVLADNGIEADEVQSVLQAVGYALADVELYSAPEYGPLDWLTDAAKARDGARDYVERIWSAWLREDDAEKFRDYWVVGDKVRVAFERQWASDFSTSLELREYPSSIFESERTAHERAAKWKDAESARGAAALEEESRRWQENVRRNELAELKRLKEKYEGAGAEGGAE